MKQIIRDWLAKRLAECMRHFAFDPRYFNLWQLNGYHVKQIGFYSPIPDTRDLSDSMFERFSEMPGVDLAEDEQLKHLIDYKPFIREAFECFSANAESSDIRFSLGNSSFESVDAEMLYGMIRRFKPRLFIEIGSGYSTLLTAEAMARNASEGTEGSLIAIEPYPPDFLLRPTYYPLQLIVERVQNVPIDQFEKLSDGDILFIDSSHICNAGSDVQYEFLEILPRLAPGVIVHIHDIFFPCEYPPEWIKDQHRFWNEQYLLQAFLCLNHDYEVLWAGSLMHRKHSKELADIFQSYDPTRIHPASFWMRRRQSNTGDPQ